MAVACGATAAQVERLVRGWRQADREAQPDAAQVPLARRTLSTRVDEDGMVVLRARLTPEVGAVVLRALEAALEQVPAAEDDAASSAQRRADALGLVAESALAGGLDPGSTGDRFQVTVHVAADGLSAREVGAVPRHVPRKLRPATRRPAKRRQRHWTAWRTKCPASTRTSYRATIYRALRRRTTATGRSRGPAPTLGRR